MKISHVNYVDVFPGSKKATVEYVDSEGEVVLKRLGAVWQATFHDSTARFNFCSFMRMIYDGQGICIFDTKARRLFCKREEEVNV